MKTKGFQTFLQGFVGRKPAGSKTFIDKGLF
jgi:hypothetical protein